MKNTDLMHFVAEVGNIVHKRSEMIMASNSYDVALTNYNTACGMLECMEKLKKTLDKPEPFYAEHVQLCVLLWRRTMYKTLLRKIERERKNWDNGDYDFDADMIFFRRRLEENEEMLEELEKDEKDEEEEEDE